MISAPSLAVTSLQGDEVAQALAHLAARAVDREAVREQAAVGRVAFDRAGDQQRRVEPAAVLVVALEVEVGFGAPAVVVGDRRAGVAAAQDVEEGRAGIEPDVEDVVALGVVRRRVLAFAAEHVFGASAATRPRRRLRATTATARSIRASVSGCSSPRHLVQEERQRHAPVALPADAPVGPVARSCRAGARGRSPDRSSSPRSRRARISRSVSAAGSTAKTPAVEASARPCARTTAPRRGRSPASCGASSADSCA